MSNRRNLLKILVVIFVAAVSGMFAAAFCGCAEKEPNGVYVLGTENGEIVSNMTVGKKKVTLVTKTDTAEYSYKRAGNKLTLDTGVEIVSAEGGDVIYMPHLLVWRNGYVSSSDIFGPLRQRDGYFTQVFSTEKGGKVTSEMVFAKDGGFSMLVYNNNQITGHSYGTYEFESGLLTITDVSSEEKTEQVFFYVDGDYNIYRSAGVKQTSSLYKPADPNNSGTVTPPDNPDNPDTPDKPDIPDKTEYTLTYAAGAGGRIIGTVSQTVVKGESGASVIAVADDGYSFIGWSDGVETAERQDSNVSKNIVVSAYFEKSERLILKGSGTEDSPYQISSAYLLNKIREYPQAHFILTRDITLNDVEEGKSNFTPMFSDDNMFNGVFDGNGYKISNIKIVNTQTFYTGLFACIGENGCVKNLTLENVDVSGTNYIGAVAAYSLGVIENCNVTGEIDYLAINSYKVFIGGIVGRIENKLNNCSCRLNISCDGINGEAYIAGLAGYIEARGKDFDLNRLMFDGKIDCKNANSTLYVGGLSAYTYAGYVDEKRGSVNLTQSGNAGQITISGSSEVDVGGVVGRSEGPITISGSYATGNITATGGNGCVYVGGFIGRSSSMVICESYSTCVITAETSWASVCVGGLAGLSFNYNTISGSYTTGNITATSGHDDVYVGGLVGDTGGGSSNDSTTISGSYATGNITAISDSYSVFVGGFIGRGGKTTISQSYAAGDITATGGHESVFVGGLIGQGGKTTISQSYTAGGITASIAEARDRNFAYVGGFAGSCSSELNISSAYTVSEISVTTEGQIYAGAFAGYVDSFELENTHWLYSAESGAEYAIGYDSSMGIPSSIGATKHTEIADFYTLADVLNIGLEKPVWEHAGDAALPSLKKEND